MTVQVYLMIAAGFAILGFLLGHDRGHPLAGFLLGAAFGIIGVIVILTMPRLPEIEAKRRARKADHERQVQEAMRTITPPSGGPSTSQPTS